MTNAEKALQLHEEWNGKFETTPKMKIQTREDLALAYTPGVAEPCKVIAKDKEAPKIGRTLCCSCSMRSSNIDTVRAASVRHER